MVDVTTPLELPCGVRLANRLAKAAMTERLAGPRHDPTPSHAALYARWAQAGAGLMITGNVMVCRDSLESACNVVVDERVDRAALAAWAAAAQGQGHMAWVQVSHPGRQTSFLVNPHPVSASSVRLRKLGLFATPRAMTTGEIERLVEDFAAAATRCQAAGFAGVQLHAAHGYLLSQFLSPLTNQRQDQFGGSLANRARLLLSVVAAVRASCGASYPIAVKLNSADFQRGGFGEDESLDVIAMLQDAGIDLLEISGGTYEKLAFFAPGEVKRSTLAREAFFLDFATKAKKRTTVPLMVTGGFRTAQGMNLALREGVVDVIGLARPYLWQGDYVAAILRGEQPGAPAALGASRLAALRDFAEAGIYDLQLGEIARGQRAGQPHHPDLAALRLLGKEAMGAARHAMAKFRW